MSRDEWLTPPTIVHALGEFDMDPAAQCPGARVLDTAKRHFCRHDNGLAQPWEGRVWLNPPYGAEISSWMSRMQAHGRGTALVFARTETSWFHEFVWLGATALFFPRGRIRFLDSFGRPGAYTGGAPSVFVAYGEEDAEALSRLHLEGCLVRLSSIRHLNRKPDVQPALEIT